MAYDSDLTNSQWELIKDLIPVGCNAKIDRRRLVNAVFYVTKTGCQWRQLPKDFPNWSTTHSFFKRNNDIWEKMMNVIVLHSRKNLGCKEDPSCAIIDSKSLKTNNIFEESGYDGYKKNIWYKNTNDD